SMHRLCLSTHQELLICFSQFGVAQQEEASVLLRQSARLPQEAHIDLFKQAIALLAIAMFAASHEVFPRALSPTRTRNNMVKRQIAAALATVLASFVIAKQNI